MGERNPGQREIKQKKKKSRSSLRKKKTWKGMESGPSFASDWQRQQKNSKKKLSLGLKITCPLNGETLLQKNTTKNFKKKTLENCGDALEEFSVLPFVLPGGKCSEPK